jgi:hypothetical protein
MPAVLEAIALPLRAMVPSLLIPTTSVQPPAAPERNWEPVADTNQPEDALVKTAEIAGAVHVLLLPLDFPERAEGRLVGERAYKFLNQHPHSLPGVGLDNPEQHCRRRLLTAGGPFNPMEIPVH